MFKKILSQLKLVPPTYLLYTACLCVVLTAAIFVPTASNTREIIVDVPRQIVAPHVVAYVIPKMNNRKFATGFHIKFLGKVYILTNRHVCDLNKEQVDGELIKFGQDAEKVIAVDTEHDLCLVTSRRTEGLSLSATPSKPMDKIFLVGHPRGIELTIREGRHISEVEMFAPWLMPNPEVTAIQISAMAYGGNSGSPVTNEQGQVVGVLFAGDPRYPSEPMVVPHQAVVNFLMRVILKAPAGFNLSIHNR